MSSTRQNKIEQRDNTAHELELAQAEKQTNINNISKYQQTISGKVRVLKMGQRHKKHPRYVA